MTTQKPKSRIPRVYVTATNKSLPKGKRTVAATIYGATPMEVIVALVASVKSKEKK